jgi:hypothetical protein
MLRFRHSTLIIISGITWLAIGAFLLPLGLGFIVESAQMKQIAAVQNPLPLLHFLANFVGDLEQAAMVIVALALITGFFKGRFVLKKSVNRVVARIRSFPEPTPIVQMYSLPYLLLISFMVSLGMSMKYLGIPLDIRGMIDVAVGSALINGSMLYFRLAYQNVEKRDNPT